jgi:hypothetical protein
MDHVHSAWDDVVHRSTVDQAVGGRHTSSKQRLASDAGLEDSPR